MGGARGGVEVGDGGRCVWVGRGLNLLIPGRAAASAAAAAPVLT